MLDQDNNPTENKNNGDREFFIGGWDPYVVELTRVKRETEGSPHRRQGDEEPKS